MSEDLFQFLTEEKIITRDPAFVVVGVQSAGKSSFINVKSGDYVAVQPSYVMTHDNTAAVMSKFKSLKTKKMFNPKQVVFTLDHNVQDHSTTNIKKYSQIRAFAKRHEVDFYPAGRGIGHQIMVEEGYAFPGTLVVASDSHSNMYGGVGCLGTPVVRTDAAAIWSTGQTWWQVPNVTRVCLEGELSPGVTGKDVIITLCGHFNNDEVLNHAVEFTGDGVSSLGIDERLAMANMTTEWGAIAGVFPIDNKVIDWLKEQHQRVGNEHSRINNNTINELAKMMNELKADGNASYDQTITLDLSTVIPHVSGPNHVKVMKRVDLIEKEQIKIDKAYVVSCVNSRKSDLAAVAQVLKGKKIADHVEMYVAPASSVVQEQSEADGDWSTILLAGAKPLPAGCGPCIGLGEGLLKDNEIGISATNRNFKGRMGSPNAEAYLASPTVVAASAINGYISNINNDNNNNKNYELKATIQKHINNNANTNNDNNNKFPPLLSGFPQEINGNLVLCNEDNINTDGIYPGKYTYREDLSPNEMADVAMENFDTEFNDVVKNDDLLIGGYNFGCGSSREQAVTCLKYKGIPCLIAGSYSSTYLRNALNNGFLVLESPAMIDYIRNNIEDIAKAISKSRLLYRLDEPVTLDFKKWNIRLGAISNSLFPLRPLGLAAQELIVAGGLEEWVRQRAISSKKQS